MRGEGDEPANLPAVAEYSLQEQRQNQHYDEMGEAYAAAYGDRWATLYRDRFIHGPMFDGLEPSGLSALEVMAGAGSASKYLLARGARATGLDISEVQLQTYREACPGCPTVRASVLDSGVKSESFDLVVAVGGLHHIHPAVDKAIDEIHRVLRPGGWFCFCDPHTASLMDLARRAWYRWDPLFAEEEAAVDFRAIASAHAHQFDIEVQQFMGNVAYVAVFNSMVLRMPPWLKSLYAPLVMQSEVVLNRLLPTGLTCYGLARWRKK